MDGCGSSKDDKGGPDEVKYRGVRISNKGKFEAEICDVNRNNAEVWLGTFATAEEARAYDKVSYQMQGRMVVLNFPTEYKSTFSTAAYNASTMAATAGAVKSSSSGSVQGTEVFEIEYLDDKLLEDLLGCDDKKN